MQLLRDQFDTEDQAWPQERLRLAGMAKRKMRRLEAAGVELAVDSGGFSGVILDNVANADREGAGFNPLRLASAPAGANIFRDDAVGLNFEHVFNGTAVSCHDIAGIWVALHSSQDASGIVVDRPTAPSRSSRRVATPARSRSWARAASS